MAFFDGLDLSRLPDSVREVSPTTCCASSKRPVATRAATGTYQTKSNIERDQPTKSYLLAGDERSVGRIAELLASEAVRGGERAAC